MFYTLLSAINLHVNQESRGAPLATQSPTTMTSITTPTDLEKHQDDHQVSGPPGHRVKAAALVIEDDSDANSTTLVYRAKVAVLNDAIQEIGMGRYQW